MCRIGRHGNYQQEQHRESDSADIKMAASEGRFGIGVFDAFNET
jgi:hypothetical protein